MNNSISKHDVLAWLSGKLADVEKIRAIEEDLRLEGESQVQAILEQIGGQVRLIVRSRKSEEAGRSIAAQSNSWRASPTSPTPTTPDRPTKPTLTPFKQYILKNIIRASIYLFFITCVISSFIIGFQNWQSKTAEAATSKDVNFSYKYPMSLPLESPLLASSLLPMKERRAILERLLPNSESLSSLFDRGAALRGKDVTIRVARAKALVGRARLSLALGNSGAALDNLDEAQAICVALPRSMDRENALADIALSRAAILGPQQNYDDLLNSLNDVIPKIYDFCESNNSEASCFRLARLLGNRANCRSKQAVQASGEKQNDLFNMARKDYDQSIQILSQLAHSGTAEEQVIEWLSRTQGNLGLMLLDQARTQSQIETVSTNQQAMDSFGYAVNEADALIRRSPSSLAARDAQVAAVINLGDGLLATGDLDRAEATYRRSIELYDSLHADYPDLLEFAWGQGLARKSFGSAILERATKLLKQDEPHRASLELERANFALSKSIEIYENLITKYPGVRDIQEERDSAIRVMRKLQSIYQHIHSNNK